VKALSLTQPWASLVAVGAKRIETRSWRTPYRGALAIHAAKRFPADARDFTYTKMARESLVPYYAEPDHWLGVTDKPTQLDKNLPLGCVIATCRLISCIPTREIELAKKIGVDQAVIPLCPDFEITEQEYAFGNYSLGRWAWLLADIKLLPEPIPIRGARSLWEWEPVHSANGIPSKPPTEPEKSANGK